MFIGKVFHQIDDKGRIRFPVKFKDELGKDPIIMQAPNNTLRVYPNAVATKIFQSLLDSIDFTDDVASDAQAFLSGNSEEATQDNQGRTLLTQDQMEYAMLKKEIVIEGALDHVEIWDKERWLNRKGNTNMNDVFHILKQSKSGKEKEN